jgi:hypothetical protein
MNPKRATAIDLLVKSEIWPVNYVPYGLRFLWWLGIDVPPPIFADFWPTVIIRGCFMTAFFGLFMLALNQGKISKFTLFTAVSIGAANGLITAYDNRRRRIKFNLPLWREI